MASTNSYNSVEKWTLLATILASSLVFIDGSALNVALPALQEDLNITGTELLWVVNGYALFLSALLLLGGSLGDIYGRNRIFLIGLALFSLSSLVCGISQSPLQLIIARCFQGVGGALLTPGSLSILSAQFGATKRGRAIGLWSTFGAMMGLIGPVLGGWLANIGLWRVIFFLNVPLSLLVLYAVITKVPETKNEAADTLDLWGAITVTLGLAGITFGFIESPKYGFEHLIIITSLALGTIFIVLFLIIQKKSKHPMMPLTLFKSRVFSSANLLTLFLYATLGGVLFFAPLNFIQIQGYTELQAGLSMLPVVILISTISPFMGKYVDLHGSRTPLIVGPMIVGCGFFFFSFAGITAGVQDYWTTYFPAFVLLGIGLGSTVAPLTTAVMGSVPEGSIGVASGINNAVARTAGVLAVALIGSFVLFSFKGYVYDQIKTMSFTPEVEQAVISASSNLGAAVPPEFVSNDDKRAITDLFHNSFVASFDRAVYIGAIMAWISGLVALIFIKRKDKNQS
ncbi:MAG TPA: MFS transporter [Fulvivirga sp.]|nr:MFS transporter [Fulvivirga sp.]